MSVEEVWQQLMEDRLHELEKRVDRQDRYMIVTDPTHVVVDLFRRFNYEDEPWEETGSWFAYHRREQARARKCQAMPSRVIDTKMSQCGSQDNQDEAGIRVYLDREYKTFSLEADGDAVPIDVMPTHALTRQQIVEQKIVDRMVRGTAEWELCRIEIVSLVAVAHLHA